MPVIPLPGLVPPPSPPGGEGWCGWDVNPSCPGWSDHPPDVQEDALLMATTMMWAALGRRYGPCQITVRPCQSKNIAQQYRTYPVWGDGDGQGMVPYLDGGVWRNCGCGGSCCCRASCEITLRGPVAQIVQVRIDGEVIPPSSYRLDTAQGRYQLVRTDEGCWPTCQDFDAAGDDVGGFEVTYTIGRAVPGSVLIGTGMLACEIAKNIAGGPCKLPRQLSSLTRQGVDLEVVADVAETGVFRTGIVEVDNLITLLNPGRRQGPMVVISPDAPEWGDRRTILGGP